MARTAQRRSPRPGFRPAHPAARRSLRNVDAKLRYEMRLETAFMLKNAGSTVLYVTQDYKEAMACGDRIAVLLDGDFVQVASPTRSISSSDPGRRPPVRRSTLNVVRPNHRCARAAGFHLGGVSLSLPATMPYRRQGCMLGSGRRRLPCRTAPCR